jgi:diguanylate cyclase (GGDEF)-like protein
MPERSKSSRMRALLSTHLLDSAPEHAFDRLTRLAAGLLGAPVALVSLVDERRQFFKSALGLREPWASIRETPLSHSFCQYVTRDRAAFVVSDTREHPLLRGSQAITDLNAIAYAGVPLLVADEAIGALCVLDEKPRDWSVGDVQLLRDLAASVVSEIELRITLRTLQEQRRLTDALLEEVGDGVLAVDQEGQFLIVNRAARRLFDAAAETGKNVDLSWLARHGTRHADGRPLGMDEGALVRGLRGETTDGLVFSLRTPGASQDTWVEASGRPVRDTEGEVIAAVAVYRDVTERRLEAEQRERLLLVDALTGIPNRRAAEAALRVEGLRHQRAGTPLSVAIFDVDHFKRVNDEFGHATGDEVLRQVAATLAGCARATDTVGRWGGEEFVAVLSVPREGALAFGERVRLAVEGLRCPPVERITISVGVAEIKAGESTECALARADKQLYEAKRTGRNRVKG